MDRTDEDLIADYLEGDEKAFEELTKRHLTTVYSFVYRLVGETHAAEDITQEVFLKAWKSLKKYNPETSKFKTWMLRIARNAAIDYLRKRKYPALSEFEDEEGKNSVADTLTDEALPADEAFAEAEDVELVTKAVMELSPAHREILTLHYTNHLTFEEIGQMLKEPNNTVKSRHHRALLALRKILSLHAPKPDR
jgi:RNA polymerase sigma-70 factor (ECF subfamily)